MQILRRGLLALLAALPALAQNWPPQPPPQIVLRGSEHSGRFLEDNPGWPMHLVTLFVTEKNIDSAWHTPRQHMEWASRPWHSYVADGTGAFVIIAHPGRNQFEQITSLPTLDAMEVNHSGDAARYEELWDRVLSWRVRNGLKPIWGTGADDTHSITNIDLSWIALRLPELTEAAIKRALRSGGFYVSSGPVIADIQVRGRTVELTTAEPADIRWLRDGQYGVGPAEVSREAGPNRCLRIEKNVTRGAYTLDDPADVLFLRAVVTTGQPGKAAQTQPFVLRAGNIENPYPAAGRWHKGVTHNHGDYPEGSEERIVKYHAAYAAKGHTAAFETPYEYWLNPIANYPVERAPWIVRVEPRRVTAGASRKIAIYGSGFAEGARLLLNGQAQRDARRVSSEAIEFTVPAALPAGRYEVTVTNPDGLQHTQPRALIVQPATAQNDGWTEFTPFNAKLGSLRIYAVAADQRRGVWVATNYGISRFDGQDWTLYRETPEPGAARLDNVIYNLAPDSAGTLWFTCLRGVGALHPDGSKERWEWQASGFPRNQINQVLRAGDTTYVTMHNLQGLFALRDGKWNRIPVEAGGNAVINAIVRADDGVFWLGTSNGLLRWDQPAGKWEHFTTANSGLPDNYVRRLAIGRDGALWVATATRSEKPAGGVARFHRGVWTVYNPANSRLPERRVWSVFADSRSRVWAATSRGVACLLPGGEWRVYDMLNSGLADDLVTGVSEDGDGNMWFSTAYGVSRLRRAP